MEIVKTIKGVICETLSGGQYHWSFFCPGCNDPHTINDTWAFDGNYDKPTFKPSIKTWHDGNPAEGIPAYCCHSYIKEGRIEFLSDCTHESAGLTLDLPAYPVNWM